MCDEDEDCRKVSTLSSSLHWGDVIGGSRKSSTTSLSSNSIYTRQLLSKLPAACPQSTAHRHRLSQLLHDELHWLNVPDRVQYKLTVTVLQCLQNQALKYLVDCCIPVSNIATCQHLRSTSRHHLTVQRYQLSTLGRRASLLRARRPGMHCQTIFTTSHAVSVTSIEC